MGRDSSHGARHTPCASLPSTQFFMMKAKSKQQQKAAGAALSAKRGDAPKKSLKGASKGMYESMNEDQLEDMASTKRKGKPRKKS